MHGESTIMMGLVRTWTCGQVTSNRENADLKPMKMGLTVSFTEKGVS
jgi:hypothetical protein